MTGQGDLERRISDFYEAEAPGRAPDWVLAEVLDQVDTTRQRRLVVHAPWRFQHMNPYARIAVAAIAAIAVGVIGLTALQPGRGPGVGGPPQSMSAAPSPSPSVTPSPAPLPTAPALTDSFTSPVHGYAVAYPAGWTVQPATQPWVSGDTSFRDPQADFIYEPRLTDHLFLVLKSQALGARTPAEWINGLSALSECTSTEPVTVDGATGVRCAGPQLAAVTTADRGYFVRLYTSPNDAWLAQVYDRGWFDGLLASIRLRPEDAVSPSPSSTASPAPSSG